MRQNKIYMLESDDGEVPTYWAIVNPTEEGLAVFVFDEEPSKLTEEENAVAIVKLRVEGDADTTRVLAHLWDETRQTKERTLPISSPLLRHRTRRRMDLLFRVLVCSHVKRGIRVKQKGEMSAQNS